MGGGSSQPRRVTLEEDEATTTVKVSEAVARRLLGHEGSDVAKKQEPKVGRSVSAEERDEELQRLKDYYERRMNNLEQKNEEIHNTSIEQFAQAVQEVEQKFLKTTSIPICQDFEARVLACYQDNPKYTLNCSREVAAFKQCVQAQRENILTRKGG